MDQWVLRLVGSLVLVTLAADLFVTILTLRGGGSLTSRVARWGWRACTALHRRWPNHSALRLAGPAIAASVLVIWVMLLWFGWALIFAGAEGAVVNSATGQPADLWSRVYFAGYNLFTLGLGDYRPEGPVWQLLTAVAAMSGLLGITMAITYLVPLLSSAVQKQALAASMALLGETPGELAQNARQEGLEAFGRRLSSITPALLSLSRQHLAYPILHYFHTEVPTLALPLRLAVLHEGLAAALDGRQAPPAIREALKAVRMFLDQIQDEILPNAADPTDQETEAERAGRLLRALVRHDGWQWEDLWEPRARSRA